MRYSDPAIPLSDGYLSTDNVMRCGDIAFEGNKSPYFSFGRMVLNDIGAGIVSHVFDVYRPVSVLSSETPSFWKYAIHEERLMRGHLLRSTKRTTMMNTLVEKDFLKEIFLTPQIEEQKQIGSILLLIDRTIALRQRKPFLPSIL